MRSRLRSHRRATPRGAALVEFAMTLPLLLAFLAGMLELSRVLMLQHTADTAAYEGARNAMVPGAAADEAYKTAESLLKCAGVKRYSIQVSPTQITESTPLIHVKVDIPVAANSWIAPQWLFGSSVTGDVTIFCERPPMVMLTGVPEVEAQAGLLDTVLGIL